VEMGPAPGWAPKMPAKAQVPARWWIISLVSSEWSSPAGQAKMAAEFCAVGVLFLRALISRDEGPI